MGSQQPKEHILLVDDDETFQAVTRSLLRDSGYEVTTCGDVDAAEEALKEREFDLLLTDLVMAGRDGISLLGFARSLRPSLPVVMITGFASVSSAVEAMKAGAEDYLTKPCSSDELLLKIQRVLEKQHDKRELVRLRAEVSDRFTFGNIIGRSPSMRAVFTLIEQVAETDATVLIQGETGTGKELVAKAVHYNSLRKERPFVSVNCAALSETLLESELFGHERGSFTGAVKQKLGRFELANKGTLFLDEIGDISQATQAKLLRVLQEREFERVGGTETIKTDIRIISATNRNLKEAIENGGFREDLYYRLNVMPILLTPLRDRVEDIPLLVQKFVEIYSAKNDKRILGCTPAALEMLTRYPWPGNVRELENLIERAVILCRETEIDVNHLMYLNDEGEVGLLNRAFQSKMTEEELTRLYAKMVLKSQDNNKKEACRILGINFRTLQNRLDE
jgi:DNA-binding NtrC family response regulator